MDATPCVYLGIIIKPGSMESHKVVDFPLNNTVNRLKTEAEKKTSIPSASLELIYHGKILKNEATLQDSGVKNGELVHVIEKKVPPPVPPTLTYTDAELQHILTSLRTLGCTPNAPGWTRAMQLLNDESAMAEILESAPNLADDCTTLSILHEVELLAALGANIHTMRRGADALPQLPAALRTLTRLVRSGNAAPASDSAPISGFAYSLEALSEDEDGEEEGSESGTTGRSTITQEQLANALQAATEAVSMGGTGGSENLLRLLRPSNSSQSNSDANTPTNAGSSRSSAITSAMIRQALTDVMNRADSSPMEHTAPPSSNQSPLRTPQSSEQFTTQLRHMHEMGLLDDSLNVRALLICAGDVNAAINLVFSGAISDE